MKIEKLNDNQIRCTLNGSDLSSRHLSLLELAYGTEKARRLFHEMIERAGSEVGFHVDDVPLMIEAIPLSNDSIILIISKIDDPDELDTRFARFAPGIDDNEDPSSAVMPPSGSDLMVRAGSAGDILDALSRMIDSLEKDEKPTQDVELLTVFRFRSLDDLMKAASVLKGFYVGENSLYRSTRKADYFLVVHKSGHSPEEFNKVCNILTEYGSRVRSNDASEDYFREHLQQLAGPRALQDLAV